MCQVFHDVEFRIIGHRLLGSVDGDHAVLGPAPGAVPAEWQYHVPVDVSIHTVAQVVMQQGEHVVGVLPRVSPGFQRQLWFVVVPAVLSHA